MKTAMYVYLAVGCGLFGVVFTFVLMFACSYFGVDLGTNMWIIAIPITLAVMLNIVLIEVFSRKK